MNVVFPEGFKDGNLADMLGKVCHSPEIGVGEIIDLPDDILERMKASGATFTNNPDEMEQHKYQATHVLREKRWREAQEKASEEFKVRQEKDARREKLAREQELAALRERLTIVYGREERVVRERIEELERL